MTRFFLPVLFLAALFSSVPAFYNGRNMPGTNFSFFETRHFKVIYQSGLDSLARRAALTGETAFPILCRDLWVKDRDLPQINIVLTDMDDESNGFSSVVGQKIELFAYPMLAVTTGDLSWIDRVVVHELAHQITYMALRRSFGLYSSIYYTFFLPTWFVEGIAQFEAETWDKNREFFLRSAYNKFQFLGKEHLYGYMGTDYIGARLLYEEGHSLVRFLVQNHGRDICGRILNRMSFLTPTLDHALKKVIGVDQATLLFNWRLMLEKDYPLSSDAGRIGGDAKEVNVALSRGFAQVYSLKRAGEGFLFTGIERTDVFEKNLYAWFPGQVLKKIDGPDAGTFFTLLPDGKSVCYSVVRRNSRTGAMLNVLYVSGFSGHARALNSLEGEEPCALEGNRILFLRRRMGFTQLFSCDENGRDVKEIALPPGVPQAYRPLFAGGRVYLSVIDAQGERKAASLLPDGKDFRIEAEKKGVDIRFPTVNAEGELAYASNEQGPFNIVVRDGAGALRQVTADPYGVFAPDFDGSGDSILVTALRDDAENFNLSVFSTSTAVEKQGEAWNMDLEWKTVTGFDHASVSDSMEELEGGRSAPYYGLLHLSPVLVTPSYSSDNGLGVQVELMDPAERHDALFGVLFQGASRGPGITASYTNHDLYPDITLSYLRFSQFSKGERSDGLKVVREKERDIYGASMTWPLNLPGRLNTDQSLFLGAAIEKSANRDSISDGSSFLIVPSTVQKDVPLSFGWSIARMASYGGNFTQPLDAFALSTEVSVSSRDWGSDNRYRLLGLDYRQSVEIMKSFQTVFVRAKAATFLEPSNYSFSPDQSMIPRGMGVLDFGDMERYLSGTAEYRIPLWDDLGFSLLGLYFERFVVGPYLDGFAWNGAGIPLRDYREAAKSAWTAGLQGRQRIYFMGKMVLNLQVLFYYDKEKSNPYGSGFQLSGESGF